MTEIEVREERSLVVPTTGEIVDLDDEQSCAVGLEEVRRAEGVLRDLKRQLVDAIVIRSEHLGQRTIHMEGGKKIVVKGGSETVYDAEEIEQELRAAGMPEERIREIVVEQVAHKVSAVEAKRAAGANPLYAEIIERHCRSVEKAPTVSLERR